MTRKSLKIEIAEGEFEFYETPNINEKSKIEKIMVELLGGSKALADIDYRIREAANSHNKHCREKFGQSVYLEKLKEIEKLEKAGITNEYFYNLYNEVNNNPHYIEFMNLLTKKAKAADYGHLVVMVKNNPKGISLETCNFMILDKILEQVVKQRNEIKTEQIIN